MWCFFFCAQFHPHLFSAGGWARRGMGRDSRQEAAHEEFHFVAFQLNPPASPGQAGAHRHASGWPSVLNISDTLMVEADRNVCLVSFRKRIVFKLSVQPVCCIAPVSRLLYLSSPWTTAGVTALLQLRRDRPNAASRGEMILCWASPSVTNATVMWNYAGLSGFQFSHCTYEFTM